VHDPDALDFPHVTPFEDAPERSVDVGFDTDRHVEILEHPEDEPRVL
jgi:hypothetical protein